MTVSPTKRLSARFPPGFAEVRKRDGAVADCIQKLVELRRINREAARKLGDALSPANRPRWITLEERRRLMTASPRTPIREIRFTGGPRTSALQQAIRWRMPADVALHLAQVATRGRNCQRESKKGVVRRLAAKIQNDFLGTPEFFRPPGRPRYSYEPLVIQYIDAIEEATGAPLKRSRPRSRDGRLSGPEIRLLIAALGRALYTSGPPSLETVARIIRQRRFARMSPRTPIAPLEATTIVPFAAPFAAERLGMDVVALVAEKLGLSSEALRAL